MTGAMSFRILALAPDVANGRIFLFLLFVAGALVTSADSLCVTFPFGDSPISRNKTAKVAARACLLETTEPAVIHVIPQRIRTATYGFPPINFSGA
jgi:hypothetical protein